MTIFLLRLNNSEQFSAVNSLSMGLRKDPAAPSIGVDWAGPVAVKWCRRCQQYYP